MAAGIFILKERGFDVGIIGTREGNKVTRSLGFTAFVEILI